MRTYKSPFALALAFVASAFVAAGVFVWVKQTKAITLNLPTAPIKPIVAFASGAAQSNVATMTGATGMYTYIEGFDISGGGATAASIIEVTMTGLSTNPKFEVPIAAGILAPAFSTTGPYLYSVRFPTPLISSATNTNIVVTCPSFGAGNTNASIVVYGYTAP